MPRTANWRVQHVPTRAGNLYVRHRDGKGIPLVMWPSIFYDHSLYLGLCEWLDNPLVLLDGPGHGRSNDCPETINLDVCARALDDVMSELAIESAILVGTSWGGLVAMVHGLSAPASRIRGLILANTPFGMSHPPSFSSRLVVFLSRLIPNRPLFREGVAKAFFSPQTRIRHPEVIANFHSQTGTFEHPDLARVIRSVLIDRPSLLPRLPELRLPVLVMAGEDDSLYPASGMRELVAPLPDHTLEVIPGSGHISLAERPHESAIRIQKWLSSRFADA